MSAQRLAERCEALGLPVKRSTIANLESGRRDTLTLTELVVLARALDVPPILLIYPVGYAETVEALPGQEVPPWTAAKWFTGEDSEARQVHAADRFRLHERWERAELEAELHIAEGNGSAEVWAQQKDRATDALMGVRESMRQAGLTPPPLRPYLAKIEASRLRGDGGAEAGP